MNKEEYELFKKDFLEEFKGYYKKGKISKTKLKENIYKNPKLLDWQKDDFWVLIGGTIKK